MELTPKQRLMVRRIVGLASDMTKIHFSFYQGQKEVQVELVKAKAAAALAEGRLTEEKHKAGVMYFSHDRDRQFYLSDFQRKYQHASDRVTDLTGELERITRNLEAVAPQYSGCRRLAEGLLGSANVNQDFSSSTHGISHPLSMPRGV